MAVKKTEELAIDYTARDFSSIRSELTNYVKRYYPGSYKDFNEASFGSLMVDLTSYVGDMLSFYLDYQANESFIQTALEFDNIIKIAKQMGFNYGGIPTSHGEVSFFVTIPASSTGGSPNTSYLPIIKRGSTVSTPGGAVFTLAEDVNFSDNAQMVVATVNDTTGIPLTYAARKTGRVISGKLNTYEIESGDFERFKRIEMPNAFTISEIISVYDSNGNRYYEVDYLSQDVIYKEIKNPNVASGMATSILKPVSVPRRFVVDRTANQMFLQFGHGSESEIKTDPIAEPNKTVLNLHGRDYITEQTFDPTNLISSDKLGVGPAGTKLTIVYRQVATDMLNAPVGAIKQIDNARIQFFNSSNLDVSEMRSVRASAECLNEEPLVGDNVVLSTEEIKQRAYGKFYSQNRAVTMQDYKTMIYSMPEQFGAISRCSIVQDNDSFKRNLNLFILAKDKNGRFALSNEIIKQNLKYWINRHRMINDSVDILDGRIINLGVKFTVLSENGVNKFTVLQRCYSALANLFSLQADMGQPLDIMKIYKKLNLVAGVADTTRVQIVRKFGSNYSGNSYDLEANYSADRRFLLIPHDAVYEFKYLDTDFEGVIL